MARGDKNYDKVVRKQGGKSADSKKKAIHKMVEALIAGDSDVAAEELHKYLQIKTREIIVGEAKHDKNDEDEKEDKDSDDDNGDDDDDDKDDDKDDKKEKVDEGNSLRDAPVKNNDTGGKKVEKHGNDDGVETDSVKGNSLKSKPKKSNDTKAKAGITKMADAPEKGVQKDKVDSRSDGRDYDMGTGNV